jgi:hypothetical protein
MAWFLKGAQGVSEPRYNLFATRLGRLLAAPALLLVLRPAGVGIFLLIVRKPSKSTTCEARP